MSPSQVRENTRHVYELVALCASRGVRHAVVSPGSRCAPLLIGFGRHPRIRVISVTDERAAAYLALGLAQQASAPVALACTSGTAALNFAPALAEAFYQNVPLIALTADRPAEWIDQWDNQTIHQPGMYGDHVRASVTVAAGDREALKLAARVMDEAIWLAPGPVHINVPIAKPFYPRRPEDAAIPERAPATPLEPPFQTEERLLEEFADRLRAARAPLILAGQDEPREGLAALLERTGIPLAADVTANLHRARGVHLRPGLLFGAGGEALRPDLLITIGRAHISETLKDHLRRNGPEAHFHIGAGMVGDPFRSLTHVIRSGPAEFFSLMARRGLRAGEISRWRTALDRAERKAAERIAQARTGESLNQFSLFSALTKALPEGAVLHLGNSMPARVAALSGGVEKLAEVRANRGVSGIDGSLSAAVGHALADPARLHLLFIGDLSFFYDRNGLWLNGPFPPNLKIVVVNNGGGGIFRVLPGPAAQGELEALFTTPHARSVRLAAEEFGLACAAVSAMEELEEAISALLAEPGAAILEAMVDSAEDARIFSFLNTGSGQ